MGPYHKEILLNALHSHRKANRIFDKAIRDDGVPLPQERVLSKHRQLMALIQLYEIRKSIQQGKKSVAWWQTLLRAYVGKDDWVLTWRKVIKKGPCQPKVDDMPRLITKEATRMSGQDPMRRLRSSLEVNNLHGSVAVLLEKRWSKLTRLPLLKIPKHRQQGQTTEKRRVERDELLKQFPKIARYVLQAEAILPGSGAAALSSKLTIWQLSKIVCILGAQAQDVSYCGAHTLFRTFEKAELAQIGAKLCKQPVKYVWLLQLKQAMTDDQCKRWLSVQQENSTVARNNLLDEQGRHLFEMKTPAAKLSEKSYFRYRAKDALVAQAQEDAGTGRSWSCQRYEPPPEKIKELTLIYRQLWEETPNCPLCGVELTAINEVEAAEQTRKGVRSTNASMDRKTPGSQGGRYEANNLQCMCAGCNYLKLHYTFEATVDTVKRLRDARATWKSSSNGFIALEREPSSVPATAAQRAKIEKWAECKRRSLSSGAEKRQLSCTVSVTDITKMLLDRMCAAMLFQDAVGMVLPLEQLSIDRIDPMKGYEPTNIRLLLTQLNMIRRECPDDEPIIRYIESIRK
ncbi:unnamed protein product [Jaminaea pallidilutea]